MQTTTNTTNITKRTFEGISVSPESRNKIICHLDHIIHIIGYPLATDDDILDGVNDLLQTITEYGCGDAVSVAIKHIITNTNGEIRRSYDFSFMIDVIAHTLILNPSNGIDYEVINFDLLGTDTSVIAEHYNSPLVSKLLDNITELPENTTTAIIAGLGNFLDNVYCKFKYHSTDIPKSGNIITHIDYDSLPDDTTTIMVHNREVEVDLNQTFKRIRQHDISRYGRATINEYIHILVTTKQAQLKELTCIDTAIK